MSSPDDSRPQRPHAEPCSDDHIKEEMAGKLLHALHIDSTEVTVSVQGGRVILDGAVPDVAMKHAIEELADKCPGVQDTENRLKVRS